MSMQFRVRRTASTSVAATSASTRYGFAADPLLEVGDEPECDGSRVGSTWKLVHIEPLCISQLRGIDPKFSVQPVGYEADHQRMRERVRLAAEVSKIMYPYSGFLLDLAVHALLECLTGLDEAGKRGVNAFWKAW